MNCSPAACRLKPRMPWNWCMRTWPKHLSLRIVLNPAIPEMLSNLVLKLMAKAPEDRYQSARGLKQDLNLCLQRWKTHGKISPFELGREDRADHFLIPEKLYGRATEVASLLAAFERTAHRPRRTDAGGRLSGHRQNRCRP